MVTTIAFSGSTKVTPEEEARVRTFAHRLKVADVWVTGGAPGIDTIIAESLLDLHPQARHIIVLPSAPYNYPAVKALIARGAEPIYMPASATHADAYRARNTKMVELADKLVAFPAGSEAAFRRSGTWMTCRIARRAGRPVWELRLDDPSW